MSVTAVNMEAVLKDSMQQFTVEKGVDSSMKLFTLLKRVEN